ETVESLKKRFKKLAAVNSVKSEGALDGNFQVVFDKKGLFTLAGVVVMLPEEKILDNIKRGSAKEAKSMVDTIGEAGNTLVGSWDKIFSEGLEGHGHFVQTSTFVGNPWDNPEKKIGLASDEEFLFVPYEMTVGSYKAFDCGVIFPKTIFNETSAPDAKEAAPKKRKKRKKPKKPKKPKKQAKDQQEAAEKDDSKEPDTTGKNDSEESKSQAPAEEKAAEAGDKAAEQPVETEQKTSGESQAEDEEPVTEEAAEVEAEPEEKPEPAEPTDDIEPATGPVSETIQRMAQSSTGLPDGAGLASLAMCAKDVMQKEVLWGDVDDSVQQALTKMEQADAGYMMVGTEGSLEGIVSTFDIAAALSVYLKPMFAKWRRPIDDATLQIKIKWIMTRPVRTIKPDTSVAAIMENMRQSGLRCLPVVDQQGDVAGLVTVFDIFEALLNTGSGVSTAGKTPQAPQLA
ncbi:MAG: CBS domain-containing protein, partial [Planctomycetota bacterium]